MIAVSDRTSTTTLGAWLIMLLVVVPAGEARAGDGNAQRPARTVESSRGNQENPRRRSTAGRALDQLEKQAKELRKILDHKRAEALQRLVTNLRNNGGVELPPNAQEVLKDSGLFIKEPNVPCPHGTAHVGAHIHISSSGTWSVTISPKFEAEILGVRAGLGVEDGHSRTITKGISVELKDGCLVLDEATRRSNSASLAWRTFSQDLRAMKGTYDKLIEKEKQIEDLKKKTRQSATRPARSSARGGR
jgi:hypothetical protein